MKGLNNKVLFSVLSIFLFSVLILNSVNAVSVHNLILPVNNTNHTGTVDLSCNVTMGGATNVTFRAFDGVTTTILGVNVSNNTAPDTSFNASAVDISGLTDDSDYEVYCTVYNDTAGQKENSTINSGITFDSTSPICSATVPDSTIESSAYQDVTYSITDGLSLITNTAELTGTGSVADVNYTDATGSPRKVYSAGQVGSWAFNVDGIDRSGNTCTASVTWTTSNTAGVSSGGGSSGTTATPTTTTDSGSDAGFFSSVGSSVSNFFSSIGNWFAGWFD